VSIFSKLAPRLQEAIVARLGWSSLRPVQEEAGTALLAGKNAIILAPTAGGKTEAAMFPVLSRMVEDQPEGVGAIYVAPIKALLNNQSERLSLYTEMVGLRRFVWHGDTTESNRRKFLKDPTELLMTTPESLEVMLVSQRVDEKQLFSNVAVVIIDEVHAIAGSDRGAHLMSVLERIARLSRFDVQRVGLSATVGNPQAILSWLQGTSGREGLVVDPPKEPSRKQLRILYRSELADLAREAAHMAKGQKSLFFCQSRSTTEAVAEYMRREHTTALVHHSSVSKEDRQFAEERFNRGSDVSIICTSTLELGIDVGDLDRVFQADSPDTVGSFLQRMGRTGRRQGQTSNTTFFCQNADSVLQAAALIELAKSGWVERIPITDRCWPVLIHQLLVMSLADEKLTVEQVWVHLSQVPDFQGIHRAEFDRLISWMLRDRSLLLSSGRLVLGPKAESQFGRRNFMELFAVFSSPQSYTVQRDSGKVLGTLSQGFVDRLVDGVSCFLLGGRPWVVVRIQHDDRRIFVEPAPRGREPTWGGFLPQFLGFEVSQRILELISEDYKLAYCDAEASQEIDNYRRELHAIVKPHTGGIEYGDDEIRWWTFAGGRINSTLRYALQALHPDWQVIPNNFHLRVKGETLDRTGFEQALEQLGDVEFWENEKLWLDVAEDLPNYRLSKFQPFMPPWIEREVLANFLLDVAGAWRWLSDSESMSAKLKTVPEGVRNLTREELQILESINDQQPAPSVSSSKTVNWIDSFTALEAACDELKKQSIIGLDVETTLGTRMLCLIQVATPDSTFIVDALEIDDLNPLAPVFVDPLIKKVIHNASFERQVLARYGLSLEGVIDTLAISRGKRGHKIGGGHSLKAVCKRELDLELDKSEQTSDWSRRPLTEGQIAYAALDAEILLRLYEHLSRTALKLEGV
jgi:ATP-dependent Lhr-like helicase